MGLEAEDDDNDIDTAMDAWPEYFDVEQVPRIMKADLKQKPGVSGFSTNGGITGPNEPVAYKDQNYLVGQKQMT